MSSDSPRLNFGLSFADLRRDDTLARLDQLYLERLRELDRTRYEQLSAYRRGEALTGLQVSELLLACA